MKTLISFAKPVTGFVQFILLISSLFFFPTSCNKVTDSQGTNLDYTPVPAQAIQTTTISGYVLDDYTHQYATGPGMVFNNNTYAFVNNFFLAQDITVDKYASVSTGPSRLITNRFVVNKTFTTTSSAFNYVRFIQLARDYNDVGYTSNGGGPLLSNSTGGTFIFPNGIQMSFPDHSMVYKNGNYLQDIGGDIYQVYLNPSSAGFASKLPCYLAGDENQKRWFLKSYGVSLMKFTQSGGYEIQNDLTFYSGKAATIKFPIPSALQSSSPDSIATWNINSSGMWERSGTARKSNNFYITTVSSYVDLNFAQPVNGVYENIRLRTASGSPVVNTIVKLKLNNNEISESVTDADGNTLCFVPTNENIGLELIANPWNIGGSITTIPIGSFAREGNVDVLVPGNLPGLTTIKGTALTCNGGTITSGIVTLKDISDIKYYFPVLNGQYNASVFLSQGNNLIRLSVFNKATNETGSDTALTAASGSETIANINSCQLSTNLFEHYSIDGTNYSLEGDISSQNPLLMGMVRYGTGTTISGGATNTTNGFQFDTRLTQPGTNNWDGITGLFVNSAYYTYDNTKPFSVTFTRFGPPGGYIEGSIDVYYLTTGASRHLVGSFKVKRSP